MKLKILAFILPLLPFSANATHVDSLKTESPNLGVTIGLIPDFDSNPAGICSPSEKYALTWQYWANNRFRIAPELGLVFPHGTGRTGLMSDLNLHAVWNLNECYSYKAPVLNMYLLTGVSFQHWGKNYTPLLFWDSSPTEINSAGMNFGAGFEMNIGKHFKLSTEWRRYFLSNSFSHSSFNLGCHYLFD